MWVFLNDSFVSVVEHRDEKDVLLVRSRIQGDIEKLVPEATVFEDPSADYRYRALVPRELFQEAMSRAVDKVDYPNFKGSVSDARRHQAYMNVWSAMAREYGSYGR